MSLELRRKVKTRRYYMRRHQHVHLGFETVEPNKSTLKWRREGNEERQEKKGWLGLVSDFCNP